MSGKTMYTTIAILISAVLVILFSVYSFDRKHSISTQEIKANESKRTDSLLNVQEEKYQHVQDSIIRESNKKDSISQLKISVLQIGYNAQRTIIKNLKTIRVDSVGQVVNNVPVAVYNALINSGNKCDSMLTIERDRISQRDTINKALNGKIESEKKLTASAHGVANDFEELAKTEKKEKEKIKKINKILTKIVVIETAILVIVAIIL